MKHFWVLLFILICQAVFAQKNVNDYIEEGRKALNENGPYLAEQIFAKAVKTYPNDLAANYEYGKILLSINEYYSASQILAHAYSLDGQDLYPDLIHLLARSQKSAGLHEASLESYTSIYQKTINKPKSPEHKRAAVEISSLKRLINGEFDGGDNKIHNLTDVNTEESDFAPVYISNDEMLYSSSIGVFNMDGGFQIQQFKSKRKKDSWKSGQKMSATVNKAGYYSANAALSPDSSYLYFTLCKDSEHCKIYKAKFQAGTVSMARPIDLMDTVDLLSHPFPFLSKDGKEGLLFTAKTKSQGYDLYLSWMDEDEKYGPGSSLGNFINSPEDEIAPFYIPEKDLLFFSSTWHGGVGEQDIYYCYTPDLKNFSRLVNLKSPFNSPANDSYFKLRKDLKKGLLVSNREGGKKNKYRTCCNDIYEFDYPFDSIHGDYGELMAQLLDTIGYKPIEDSSVALLDEVDNLVDSLRSLLPIPLYFHNDEPDPKTTKRTTALSYQACLDSYLALKSQYLNIDSSAAVKTFFASTLEQSFNRLQAFIKLLIRLEKITPYPVVMAVRGYASPLAQSEYNTYLSERRISSVQNYFNSQNVLPANSPKDVLSWVQNPYGESKSAKNVSDNYYDQKNSIYSIGAMLERRVEIQWLQLNRSRILRDTVKTAKQDQIKTLFYPLGRIGRNTLKKAVIALYNPYNEDISIQELRASCSCTETHLERYDIKKGGSIPIELEILGPDKLGEQNLELIIYPSKSELQPIRVILGMEVVENK